MPHGRIVYAGKASKHRLAIYARRGRLNGEINGRFGTTCTSTLARRILGNDSREGNYELGPKLSKCDTLHHTA